MSHRGPTYCETVTDYVLDAWLPFIEPLNTVTNIVPIAAAVFAYTYMRRTVGVRWETLVLMLLATATGIGSFVWHYTRDASWLAYDVVPGLLFVLTFIFLWFLALGGRFAAYAGITAFLGSILILQAATTGFSGIVTGAAGIIGVFAVILITWTFRAYGGATGRQSILLIAIGAAAALSRFFDMTACAYIPSGTHFLWHTLLGIGAYLAIRLYVDMRSKR